MSDRPRKNSNTADQKRINVEQTTNNQASSAAPHRTPAQACLPGRTEEKPPKRLFSASPSCGREAPRGVAADEARNLWSPMAGVNTPLFRGQIHPWIPFLRFPRGPCDALRRGTSHVPFVPPWGQVFNLPWLPVGASFQLALAPRGGKFSTCPGSFHYATVRGCPCPVAGRSLRPSWPPLTRC